MIPTRIRFYELSDDGGKTYISDYNSYMIPHLGSDIKLNGMKYFVIDIIIDYENLGTCVDITLEKVNE